MKEFVGKPTPGTDVQDLTAIAVPIALSLLAQKVVNMTDAVMLGGLGPEELGAGVLATTVFFTIMTLMHGVMSRLTVLLVHAHAIGFSPRDFGLTVRPCDRC